MTSPIIYDLDEIDLAKLLTDWGEPSYRAGQIWRGLYRNFWNKAEQFSTIPLPLREKLASSFSFDAVAPVLKLESSDHQTVKTLFALQDGQKIEAVLMHYNRRNTLCISTQVGCAMGCVFCATGQMGFHRHLTSGEIVAQVIYYARLLNERAEVVTNIVVMGMGEPFHNYRNTMAAIDRLNDDEGYNFGARRFTISTVGLVPMIRKFANEKRQINLAISLHAVDNLRLSLLPVTRKYSVDDILEACREYVAITGRRITFEWALIHNVNDTVQQARLLAAKLHGLLCHVNIIPLNPTDGYSGSPTDRKSAIKFKEELNAAGIPCTIRLRRGIDIQAGCGQLAIKNDAGQKRIPSGP